MNPPPSRHSRPSSPSWPLGFVSVDIDGLWAIRQCYGQPILSSFDRDPVWLDGIPWLLDALDRHSIRATFFVVARDIECQAKLEMAREFLRRGHEIGCHSLAHRIGMSLLPMGTILDDLAHARQRFQETLNVLPRGFRSPGYDVDARLLRAIRRAGFLYDASLLPTFWGPLLRLADALVARRWDFGKRQFGRFSYGRAPLRPYRPNRHILRREERAIRDASIGSERRDSASPSERSPKSQEDSLNSDFWEIPISVTPRLRLPIGAGYVLTAGPAYFQSAIRSLCRAGLPVSFLVHGADATDLQKGDSRVFPRRASQPRAAGFSLSAEDKRRQIDAMLGLLARQLRIERMGDWAASQRAPDTAEISSPRGGQPL